MSDKKRNYKVDFYAVTKDNQQKHTVLLDILENLEDDYTDQQSLGEEQEKFQIRSIAQIGKGKHRSFKAVFGRCRFESLTQGAPDGKEADVELLPGHGLVEKNYFVYFPETNLIIYQRNSAGSHYAKLQNYIQLLSGEKAISLEPILTRDSYESILTNQNAARRVEFSISKPKDPSLYGDKWSRKAINLVEEAGGISARFIIGVGRQKTTTLLPQAVVDVVNFSRLGLAKTAKIKLQGVDEPIDLIADRVIEKITVKLDSKSHIDPVDMYTELYNSKDRREEELKVFFGNG